MINVSNEFLHKMQENTDFKESATITFSDGTVMDLDASDFTVSNNSITDAAGGNSFPLGVAVEKSIQIEIANFDDHFSTYDFYGAKIRLRLSLELSETTESINYGTYTVVSPETYGETVILTAVDDMYKTDTDYTTALSFPTTLRTVVQDVCTTCDLSLLTTTFKNDDFIVQEMPEDVTFREVLASASQIACGYARINYQGYLELKSYDFSLLETEGLDGGIFDSGEPSYQSGDTATGGSFNPWDTGDIYDGGTFAEENGVHVLYSFNSLKVETDDVVITGIQITDKDGNVYLSGSEGYVLSLENSLVSEGQEQEVVNMVGAEMIGERYRPFEADHIAYPLAEFGDSAYVIDRKENTYQTILTDINFNFYGFTTFKCTSESPLRNSSKYAASSEITKAVVEARKNTEEQLSSYDLAMQQLTNLISNSFGVFETEEKLEDGSTIFYLHNKQTLAESDTIWKMTADGFVVSTDGGQTWNAGIDSSGNAVVNVLSAIGINFDWASGGTLTLGGADNINGELRVLNSSGSQIGKWDKDGIDIQSGSLSIGSSFSVTSDGILTANSGTFTGTITASSGSIGNWTIGENKIYGGDGEEVPTAAMQLPRSGITWVFAAGGSRHSSYSDCPFRVSKAGELHATNAFIEGEITADSGTIGGFTIGGTALYNGKSSYSSEDDGVYLGTNGISLGDGFSVSNSGRLTASKGTVGGFSLGNTKIYAGDESASETIVMQVPNNSETSNRYWCFACGGSSHSNYSDCKFRVGTNGDVHGTTLYIGETNDTVERSIIARNSYGRVDLQVTSGGRLGLYIQSDSDYLVSRRSTGENQFGNSDRTAQIYGSDITLSTDTTVNGRIILGTNNRSIRGTDTSGNVASMLYMDSSNRIHVGNESYVTILYGSSVYLNGTSTAVTSDRKFKDDVTDLEFLPDRDTLFDKLTPREYTTTFDDERHMGFVYQEVVEAEEESGMDPSDYGLTASFIDDDGETVGAIRYEEIIPLLVYEVQSLKEEISKLQGK